MPKNFPLLMVTFLLASCHQRANQPHVEARTCHLRFNPPDSSTYRYNTTSEIIVTVTENGKTLETHRTSRFTVNYLAGRDSNEVTLDMTFGDIHYHERNAFIGMEVDAADKDGPVRDLVNRVKAATIFVRVQPASSVVTIGGFQELVNTAMDSFYAAADRSQASKYWGHWVDQQLVWRNLDPFVWVTLDSARYPGYRWTDTTANADEINFKIYNRFQFDTIKAGIATIRSRGQISNDPAGTWLSGKAVTGILTGNEIGRCLVDTATGMPGEMEDSVSAEGDVQIAGNNARIKIVKTITMVGGKIKS